MSALAGAVGTQVLSTLQATWPFLLLSVLAAGVLETYLDVSRLSAWLRRRVTVAVLAAVGLATLTPFCSCGTAAVSLGMLASSTPWAPVVAFLVASPLTSPAELVLSAGLFGWPFAWLFFGGTIVIGLSSGALAHLLQRAGWLEGQARMAPVPEPGCAATCGSEDSGTAVLGSGTAVLRAGVDDAAAGPVRHVQAVVATGAQVTLVPAGPPRWAGRLRLAELADNLLSTGARLTAFFLGFTALGYLVIELVPAHVLQDHLGGGGTSSVALAALLGIPAYINTEGSLPLLASLVEQGMSPGAAMAFLVTGAGTSLGAFSGLLLIARARVVALVVGCLLLGAIGLGGLTQALLG